MFGQHPTGRTPFFVVSSQEERTECTGKQRQNLRDHVKRMDRTRIPKQILQYVVLVASKQMIHKVSSKKNGVKP
jgi:hypothetical protein